MIKPRFESEQYGSKTSFQSIAWHIVVVVLSLSQVQLFVTPWTAAPLASLSFTIFRSLLKFRSTELVMLSKHLTLNCSLLLLASIFPNIRVYSNELVPHIRWPKYWSFSIFASNEYSGLISLRIDWFDLLAVQGVLESLLQYHNLKACLTFLMVQLSHLYITTGKTIALTRWTFVAK